MATVKNNSFDADAFNRPFPSRLRLLLEMEGKSQAKLAEKVGVTRQAISSYSLGTTSPDVEKFEKIADYFGVSFDYLLGRSDNKQRENTDIGKRLGLSDQAISKIDNYSSDPNFRVGLNAFLENQFSSNLLYAISQLVQLPNYDRDGLSQFNTERTNFLGRFYEERGKNDDFQKIQLTDALLSLEWVPEDQIRYSAQRYLILMLEELIKKEVDQSGDDSEAR